MSNSLLGKCCWAQSLILLNLAMFGDVYVLLAYLRGFRNNEMLEKQCEVF